MRVRGGGGRFGMGWEFEATVSGAKNYFTKRDLARDGDKT